MKTAAALAVLLLATTATADPLTLRQALEEALARNPRLVASGAGIAAARARSAQARAAWFPRAEVSAVSAQSNNPVFVFGSLLEQGRFGPEHFDPSFLNDPEPLRNDRLALNVRYTLFDQLRRLGSTRQTRNAAAQAEHGDDELRQRLRLETLRAYFGVALAGQRHEVAQAAVRAGESQAGAIRDRMQQGLVVESDLLSADVQLARYRQQQVEAEGELAIAQAALATLLQRPMHGAVEIASPIADPAPLTLSLDAAVTRGLASRGDVKAARLAAENARIEIRSARGSLLPRVDAWASWGASGATFRHSNSDRTFSLTATVDLFDAARYARIAEARAGSTAAVAAGDLVEDAAAMEIVTAFHRLRAAEQRVGLAGRSAAQAEAAARIIHDRYANGLTTITEQLRAGTAVVTAQLDLLAARYDRIVGRAELLRAMGELHNVEEFE
ncbi:MAG TPA: TolC family protein [Thermoanaerobaculia bacterium]|nr:TolC family protein [Thermoanaerobaculia bacterium]